MVVFTDMKPSLVTSERQKLRYRQALGWLLLSILFRSTRVEPCRFNTQESLCFVDHTSRYNCVKKNQT